MVSKNQSITYSLENNSLGKLEWKLEKITFQELTQFDNQNSLTLGEADSDDRRNAERI